MRIQQYTRKINLKEQYARIVETVKFKNSGTSPVSSVTLCQLASLKDREASFKVKQDKHVLKVEPAAEAREGAYCVSVSLKDSVAAGDVGTVTATGFYVRAFTPFPAEVKQGEPQLMVYQDNLYAVSPYIVSSQTTEVELPTSDIKSYTQVKPASASGSTVTFGRYDSIQPFTYEELKVHFAHPKPFMQVTQLVREIEVSHWGNIYVEEVYELKNGGSKHKGQFSRLKYGALVQQNMGNSFRDMTARLPPTARSLYYKDLIGNISSSRVRSTMTETILEFETRYPLQGGWKVDFTLGYSLPLQGFLYHTSSSSRQLVIDFGSPLDGVIVDELIVKVVLPEGASNLQVSLPFEVHQGLDRKFTYLDSTGRPVLILKKNNVVPAAHSAKLVVDYDFNPLSMLREPALLVTAFAAFFALAMVYQRWDFTISKDDRWLEAQNKDKVASAMLAISRSIASITAAVKKLEELALNATDDVSQDKASADAQINSAVATAKQQIGDLTALSPKAAADAQEVLAKAQAAQNKALAAVATRVDALKKSNSTPQELYKKSTAAVKPVTDARKELESLADKVFGMY